MKMNFNNFAALTSAPNPNQSRQNHGWQNHGTRKFCDSRPGFGLRTSFVIRHSSFGIFLLLLVLSLGLYSSSGAVSAAQRPPNVIFFLIDDWGWTDGACFGSRFYETPNIDRLASQGMKFTQGYAACTVCSPTRAAVMTGKYPARLHITDWIAGSQRPYAKLKIPDWTQH